MAIYNNYKSTLNDLNLREAFNEDAALCVKVSNISYDTNIYGEFKCTVTFEDLLGYNCSVDLDTLDLIDKDIIEKSSIEKSVITKHLRARRLRIINYKPIKSIINSGRLNLIKLSNPDEDDLELIKKWDIADKFNRKAKLVNMNRFTIQGGNLIYNIEFKSDTVDTLVIPKIAERLNVSFAFKNTNIDNVKFYSDIELCYLSLRGVKIKHFDMLGNVKSIEESSFAFHADLETIKLPDNLECIASYAFAFCSKLKQIDIPDSVEYIGDGAFNYCKTLSEIRIPNKINRLNNEILIGCENLKRIYIDGKIESCADEVIDENKKIAVYIHRDNEECKKFKCFRNCDFYYF